MPNNLFRHISSRKLRDVDNNLSKYRVVSFGGQHGAQMKLLERIKRYLPN